uniref:Putative secreted protein n=1 Tax=Anopheles triannulatus TaxID=58253 RepID=A0A2M4B2G4_9DIPT
MPSAPCSLLPLPVMLGVLVGLVDDEDWMILLHIVPLRMAFVQWSVFSDSALGEDTSTSGIRCRALSRLRFR